MACKKTVGEVLILLVIAIFFRDILWCTIRSWATKLESHTYVTIGLRTVVYSQCVVLGRMPQILPSMFLHDHIVYLTGY